MNVMCSESVQESRHVSPPCAANGRRSQRPETRAMFSVLRGEVSYPAVCFARAACNRIFSDRVWCAWWRDCSSAHPETATAELRAMARCPLGDSACVIFRISGVSLCTTSAIHHPGRLQDHFLQQQCNRAFNHSATCTCLWPLRNLSTETEAYALATMEVGVGREREKSPIINSFSDTYSIHWFALLFPAPKNPKASI